MSKTALFTHWLNRFTCAIYAVVEDFYYAVYNMPIHVCKWIFLIFVAVCLDEIKMNI